MFEQDLSNCMEFGSEFGELRNEFPDLLESDFFTSFNGTSPSHSCDSGVDVIMDEIFDVENLRSETQPSKLKPKTSNYSTTESELGLLKKVADLSENGPSDLLQPIQEDHCYTNKGMKEKFQDFSWNDSKGLTQQHMKTQELPIEDKVKSMEFSVKDSTKNISHLLASQQESEKCNNKNAVMARMNRQRKKRYVGNLESEVSHLREKNKVFISENRELKSKVSKYEDEIAYLKGILMNQSMLSSVISAVSSVPGINLTGTVESSSDLEGVNVKEIEKSSDPKLHQVTKGNGCPTKVSSEGVTHGLSKKPQARRSTKMEKIAVNARAGVCLHVNKENVSVEFCHHCSRHASAFS